MRSKNQHFHSLFSLHFHLSISIICDRNMTRLCISSDLMLVMTPQSQGPHIYQTCPSANYYDCKAMAIGARSQSARTYLEKHLDVFQDCMYIQLKQTIDLLLILTLSMLVYLVYLVCNKILVKHL